MEKRLRFAVHRRAFLPDIVAARWTDNLRPVDPDLDRLIVLGFLSTLPLSAEPAPADQPTPEQIEAGCKRIREEGFTDHCGRRHSPWFPSTGCRTDAAQPAAAEGRGA